MANQDDSKIELSRRKTLAALGTVGVASAGAGLGTSAYFSDTESFDGNQLTAGSLDLKVDWEEHYSDWSDDEAEAAGDVEMTNGNPDNIPDGYVGLPDPMHPLIAVPSENLNAFMDATSIEAFPDADNDGIQDDLAQYDACTQLADTPEDLNPAGGFRTVNLDTYFGEEVQPLINLNDVKPGDFGELTLSFHLCDNPGYVWLNGALDEELTSENGHSEPESKDDDEEDGVVELLDAIQTTWWYDEDGDNVLDGGGGQPACVQMVLDASASMQEDDGDGVSRNQEAIAGARQLAEEIINAGGRVGVTFFGLPGADSGDGDAVVSLEQSVNAAGATDVATTQSVIDGLPATGDATNIGDGILEADEDLSNCDPATEQAVQVVVTDGQNNDGTSPTAAADNVTGTDTDDYTEEIYAVGTGGATESSLATFARPSDDAHTHFSDDLENLIANLSQIILSEKVFFRGTLREALSELETGQGIPLDGNRATDFDELTGDPASDARECFIESSTHSVGFAWYLPVDHANEIQTDTAGFDLGFYTEQCRHNNGAGMAPEEPAD